MQKWHHKQSKKYISKVSVGFVKCHEWRVACNRPTLACPRIIAAAIAFEVTLQVASVASSVFMTSQLYRRLSALSVLSRYCWVNACRLPPVIRYDTILMLVRSTSPLGDRASLPPVHLSVSDLPPRALFHALWQSLMGHVCCGAFIQCGSDSSTDLQAVRYRARANWIGPEPDSVLRLVRSLEDTSILSPAEK